jgi:hypothetical protein
VINRGYEKRMTQMRGWLQVHKDESYNSECKKSTGNSRVNMYREIVKMRREIGYWVCNRME